MRQAFLKEYWIYATYYFFFSSVKRVKWTEEEEREIKIFFKQYFGTDCKKKCPSMKDCLHFFLLLLKRKLLVINFFLPVPLSHYFNIGRLQR